MTGSQFWFFVVVTPLLGAAVALRAVGWRPATVIAVAVVVQCVVFLALRAHFTATTARSTTANGSLVAVAPAVPLAARLSAWGICVAVAVVTATLVLGVSWLTRARAQ